MLPLEQAAKARLFSDLHIKGTPLILYNIWDAGSARAVASSGAKALATGSWSVAASQGFKDGELIPLDEVETIISRIVTSVDLPVTLDFEGAYSALPEQAAANAVRMMRSGIIGINFEDQVIGGKGLHEVKQQIRRISAIRKSAEELGLPLFINARTDLFLKASAPEHAPLIEEAKTRALAYWNAGASGFFVPGLSDEGLISKICHASPLPVNIMMRDGVPSQDRLAELGVARISYGPRPYNALMTQLKEAAKAVYPG